MKLIIGSHNDCKAPDYFLGTVKQALLNKANALMFYVGAPQTSFRVPIENFKYQEAKRLWLEAGNDYNDIIVHAPYIINVGKPLEETFPTEFLISEIKRLEYLELNKLVLHPGASTKQSMAEALDNVVQRLNIVIKETKNVTILLETMSGKGTEIGSKLEELFYIIRNVQDKKRIGICLDTCHLNDAGYDLKDFDKLLDYIYSEVGDVIYCLHVNDSKNELGAHKDRHENIGFGSIGFSRLIDIIYNPKLEKCCKILETPYVNDKSPYKDEIEYIRQKQFKKEIFKDY
jgi:deoxyribonuclease-4